MKGSVRRDKIHFSVTLSYIQNAVLSWRRRVQINCMRTLGNLDVQSRRALRKIERLQSAEEEAAVMHFLNSPC